MPATTTIDTTLPVLPGAEERCVEDGNLVRSAQNGSVSAVRELYLCHHKQIYRFLWSRVNDPEVAEDLTGEVFVRMLKYLPRYQDRSLPFRAWLYGIARNLVIDHYRKEGSRKAVSLNNVAAELIEDESLEERTEQNLTFERVRQILTQLDPDECEVVELRFLGELSLKETALAVNKSIAAVKALQHRGLASLKEKMQA